MKKLILAAGVLFLAACSSDSGDSGGKVADPAFTSTILVNGEMYAPYRLGASTLLVESPDNLYHKRILSIQGNKGQAIDGDFHISVNYPLAGTGATGTYALQDEETYDDGMGYISYVSDNVNVYKPVSGSVTVEEKDNNTFKVVFNNVDLHLMESIFTNTTLEDINVSGEFDGEFRLRE